jgi:transcription-repair coupling factor (superfamily II helicase)
MPERTAQLSEMLPDAQIAYAHGQMRESELEKIVLAFLDRQYDVLVCSTIIENGIDIINANTMIIEDADRLGLSQLYQLRGRIGRGAVAAYAYMTYRKDKTLSEIASKRLQSIKEFTKFGSVLKSPCAIYRCAARAICSAQTSTGISTMWAMKCTAACFRKPWRKNRAKRSTGAGKEIDLAVNAFLPKNISRRNSSASSCIKQLPPLKRKRTENRVTEELIDVYADPPQSVLKPLGNRRHQGVRTAGGHRKNPPDGSAGQCGIFFRFRMDFERLQSLGKTYRLKLRPNTSVPTLLLSLPKDAEPLPFVSDLIKNLIFNLVADAV